MPPSSQPSNPARSTLQLLLFVDRRPSASQHIRQIKDRLNLLRADRAFELEVIDVGEQPYVAEHFKLVATPALVKVHPEPRQILAGSDIVAQLEECWGRWERSAAAPPVPPRRESAIEASPTLPIPPEPTAAERSTAAYSAEVIRLSDEVFRLERDKAELEDLLQFKDCVIEILAHDLRNPLAAVSVALETLENALKPDTIQAARMTDALRKRLLDHARSQVRTIEAMIADLLHASQSERAALRIQPQQADLGVLCREVLKAASDRLEVRALNLVTDIPQDLPPVHADSERVRQVLLNLLDNAIKYTPKNGQIQLSVLHRTTQKVQVSICDTGPGIPLSEQQRIFEDGFRLQRDRGNEGYGIGLAMCQRTIRAHYGQIWVDSKPGEGSCFHFTLPVYR